MRYSPFRTIGTRRYRAVLELPRGLWKWLTETARDLARIAAAAEQIAEELAEIRRALQGKDGTKREEN